MYKNRIEGNLVGDITRFPNGIGEVSKYAHENGFKFGIYGSLGTKTCTGRPGSLNWEWTDARAFAEMEVDFVKMDSCFMEASTYPEESDETHFMRFNEALRSVARPMYYSIDSFGQNNVTDWGNKTGNSWRTTPDIFPEWTSVRNNFLENAKWANISGTTVGWNDPDLIVIGQGNLTADEQKSHFALWAFSKAPLLINANMTNLTTDQVAIINNTALIAINQDALGEQAQCVANCSNNETIQAYQSFQEADGGYYANAIVNFSDLNDTIVIDFVKQGIASSAAINVYVYDLWNDYEFVGFFKGSMSVDVRTHETKAFKFQATE